MTGMLREVLRTLPTPFTTYDFADHPIVRRHYASEVSASTYYADRGKELKDSGEVRQVGRRDGAALWVRRGVAYDPTT